VRIAVVGGGIGGLTAAVALVRGGVEVTVLEQMPSVPAVGASLQLGPNATRLLDALGLLPGLRAIGSRPDAVDFLRWDDGSLLLHAEHGDAAERHFGAPQLDFFRPDLHRALVDALPPGVLRLGARVVGLEELGEQVAVVVEGGRRLRVDGIVAADGIRSSLRQQLVGAEKPVFSGTVVYRGVVDRDAAEDLHPDRVNRYWVGPARHGVTYWIGGGRRLAVNVAVQDAAWREESWTIETSPDEPLSYLDGWDEGLRERVRRARPVLRGGVFVRSPISRWSFGRVTLLGDAAHAMEPFQAQGAAQAVEDAFVLGACVARSDGDVVAAFSRYERIRMSRAAALQDASRDTGASLYLPDGPEQVARDAAYRRLPETQPWGIRQAIWEHDVRDQLRVWSSRVELG
jgi:salicylate hydroxylase